MVYVPVVDQRIDPSDKIMVMTWENVQSGDECQPIDIGKFPDASVHIFYKSGSGTTVTIKGSNDKRANPSHPDHGNADFQIAKDSEGNVIQTVTNKIYQKITNTWFLKPFVDGGGDGIIDISIHMVRA